MTKPLTPDETGAAEVLLTVDDYARMAEIGLFDEVDKRIELIGGRLIQMPATMSPHGLANSQLLKCFFLGLGDRSDLRALPNVTLVVSETSALDPDILIARPVKERRFLRMDDKVALVVEVADSSRPRDLGVKRRLYAAAGVPEYWVADVEARRLHVMTAPQPDGNFLKVETFGPGAVVSPSFAREIMVALADVFDDSL